MHMLPRFAAIPFFECRYFGCQLLYEVCPLTPSRAPCFILYSLSAEGCDISPWYIVIKREKPPGLAEQEHERNDPADAKWLQTVRRSGTTADKLAAWTVVIQENLPANMRSLDAVLNMSTGKCALPHIHHQTVIPIFESVRGPTGAQSS